jgi:hypothetical protein
MTVTSGAERREAIRRSADSTAFPVTGAMVVRPAFAFGAIGGGFHLQPCAAAWTADNTAHYALPYRSGDGILSRREVAARSSLARRSFVDLLDIPTPETFHLAFGDHGLAMTLGNFTALLIT